MAILPLAQFEEDMAEQDKATYERLKPPSSIVAKFGCMGLIGEFPFSLDVKPGCGSKFVLKTHRGTEIGEMLTSTCPNSGCGKSISRKEMLEYIERSGGKDYPFFSMQGKVLRIATVEDLNQQARIDDTKQKMVRHCRTLVEELKLPMKVVDAEPILGGEKVTFYFVSEERIDFRELVAGLAGEHQTRIEMRQVGSRDEARLTADYEKCGQHCCCKQFLKVLKPVSMKNAKIQKATLDPLKISGRCGRLMCCLRYEEQSYDDLRARLPKKKMRVSGEFGTGYVLDTQILTQLVLVQLDDKDERMAVPLEDLTILGPGGGPQGGGGGGGGGSPPRADRGGDSRGGQPPASPQPSAPRAPIAAPSDDTEDPETNMEAADLAADGPQQVPTHGERSPSRDQDGPRPPARRDDRPAQGQRSNDRSPDQRPPGGGPGGGRPQWPSGGRPGRPPAPMHGGHGSPRTNPPGDRAPQQSQPPRPPSGAPSNQAPAQRPPNAPAPQNRIEDHDHDEIDDILSGMETDHGDHGPRSQGGGGGGPQGGQPGGPNQSDGRRKRKRKRRRGGGGGGGGGGGAPNSGPPPGPPNS